MHTINILSAYNLILVRYGEIWLKSQKVKVRMLKILMNNIKKMLKRMEVPFTKYQLSKDSARIFYFFKSEDIKKAATIHGQAGLCAPAWQDPGPKPLFH